MSAMFDSVEAEPLEARFERAPDAVRAEVEFWVQGQHIPILVVLYAAGIRPHEHASDFGREGVVVPRVVAQDAPEPSFRRTVPVERCRVEVAQPRVVGCEDSVLCGGVTDAREQTAERARRRNPTG